MSVNPCRGFLCAVPLLALAPFLALAGPVRLDVSVGLGNGAIDSDGVTFRIELREGNGEAHELLKTHHARTEWAKHSLDLSAYDGQDIVLRFSTAPGDTTTYDWACWGEPVIRRDGNVLIDLTRTRLWRTGILTPDGNIHPLDSSASGAGFRPGQRTCGDRTLPAFMQHPPYRGEHAGATAVAEFRIRVGEEPKPPERPAFVRPDGLTSPFPPGRAACFRLPEPIQVDGDLDDWPAAWLRAALALTEKEQMSVEVVSHKPGFKAGWTGPQDLSSHILLGWDDDRLYIADIRVDDRFFFMDTGTQDFVGSDALRIGISTDPDSVGDSITADDYVLTILPFGEQDRPMVRLCDYGAVLGRPQTLPGVTVDTKLFKGGWILEAAIPFASLGVTPEPGHRLGFQIMMTDSDTPGDRHYEMLWRPKAGEQYWRRPSTFGSITLANRSFGWITPSRPVWAVGEKPSLEVGLFSLDGPTQADVTTTLVLTGRETDKATFPGLRTGDALTGPALPSPGASSLRYSILTAADRINGHIDMTAVVDGDPGHLARLIHPTSATLVPSLRSPQIETSLTGSGPFRLVCRASNQTIVYEVNAAPGLHLTCTADGRTVFASRADATGAILASGRSLADAAATVSDVRVEDDVLLYRVNTDDGAAVTYRFRLKGKTLVIDAESAAGAFSAFRGPLYGFDSDPLFVPYLSRRMSVYEKDDQFISTWCDWTVTNAGVCQPLGATLYRPKTDGTRNPLRERVYVTVSADLPETFPNFPNPKSPYHDVLSNKIVLDVWGFGANYADFADYLGVLKGYGVGDLAIIYHVWQRHGYDNGLPEHVPANEHRGGHEQMQTLGRTAAELGYLLSLHENYIDYYPNYPQYDEAAISLDSGGNRINAWYMPSTGIQSYRMKPSWIARYVKDQSPKVHDWYHTRAAYLDVHSVALPFQVDYDADAPGAASIRYSFDTITWLFDYMRETHGGPLFGEGNNHSVWAGRIDGCEAQIGGRGGEIKPVLVDFDLLKIHPLAVNHGMGYYTRWHRTRSGRLTGPEMDKYRAEELAYGHAGFVNTGNMSNLSLVLREYFLMQPLQSRFAPANPARIEYLFERVPAEHGRWVSSRIAVRTDAERKVRVAYDNGLTLTINDGQDGWRAGDRVLPPYGFVATGPDIEAWTALTAAGHVADYVGTPTSWYIDPRTYEASYVASRPPGPVRPMPPVVVSGPGRSIRITYRWDVNRRVDGDWRLFVHFTDNGNILWQNDHHGPKPTSQWEPGSSVVDGPHHVEIPGHIQPGKYPICVGMFQPGQGRLALDGEDTAGMSYAVGVLEIAADADGEFQAVLQPVPPRGSLKPGRNPAGTLVDVGPVRTDVALTIDRTAHGLSIMPIPHGVVGTVQIRPAALVPAFAGTEWAVTALAAGGQALGAVSVAPNADGSLLFRTIEKAHIYRLTPDR